MWFSFQDKLDCVIFWTICWNNMNIEARCVFLLTFFFFLSNVSTFLPLFPLRIIFGLCEHPKHYMYLKKKKTSQSFNQHTGEKSSLGLKAICAFKRSTNSPLTARTASSQTKCLPVMSRCASSALPAHTSFIRVREEAISFISAGNYFLIYGAWVFT